MKNKLLIIVTGLSFIFINCKSSFNSIVNKEEITEKLTEKNYKTINGNYSNHPERFIGGLKKTPFNYHPDITALDLFGWTFDPNRVKHIKENKKEHVNLEFINKKRLRMKLYRSDSLISEKIIKGKLKRGYFYSRQKKGIYPFVPLIFGYDFGRFRIGIKKNNIIMDFYENTWVAGFMVGQSSKGNYSGIFKLSLL